MVHDRLTSVLGSIGKMQIFISGRDVIWPSWLGSSGKSQSVDISEMFNWNEKFHGRCWNSCTEILKHCDYVPPLRQVCCHRVLSPSLRLAITISLWQLAPSITFCHYSLLTSCHFWDLLSLFVGTKKILWRLCSAEWSVFLLKFSVHISSLVCNLSINNSVIVYEVLTREL